MPDETSVAVDDMEHLPSAGDTPPDNTPTPPEPDAVTEEAATDDEPEALEPSTVHPAAAAGFTEEDAAAGAAEHGEFFIGMWADKPNYGCPYCYYSSIEGSGDVELHILSKIDSGDIKHREYLPSE